LIGGHVGTFRTPLAHHASTPRRNGVDAAITRIPDETRMLIVVADDDRTSLTGVAAMVRKWGHEVETASDGASALELIQRLSPDVAILDWMMPGLDGPDVCRDIRRDPAHALTYLMLLTARHEREDLLAGLGAGADDYLRKPCNHDELRARLAVASRIIESNTASERLLGALSSVLFGLDTEGRITRWNTEAQTVFGLPAAHAIGRPLSTCGVRWADPSDVARITAESATAVRTHEVRFQDTAGTDRLAALTVTTVRQGSERSRGHVVIGTDITERRRLETQLRQAQKLEGIGQLAAGIAHEINTPMQYIGDNVRYLGDSVKALDPLFELLLELCARRNAERSSEEVRALVDAVAEQVSAADLDYLRRDLPGAVTQSLEGVAHVSRIVRAMKEFSHPGTAEKTPTDLNHAIETTLVVARNEIKYVADVDLRLEAHLPQVPCLAGEINQVLLNLLINAAHAIADSVARVPGGRGRITISTHGLPGAVEIRIADTGAGIPEAIRSRLFEPFFTTKDVGKGTGQGLALAHATVVSRHGGQLWFDSVEGAGTTFYIRLPVEAREEAEKATV
jgi:PAS domain S-box-containing protein